MAGNSLDSLAAISFDHFSCLFIAGKAVPFRANTYHFRYLLHESGAKLQNDAGFEPMEIDRIDTMILAELTANARTSLVDLASRVGLSSTAIARRQRTLEQEGYIQGYQATLDLRKFGLCTTVLVRIALESQSDQALKAFEAGVLNCPSVIRCFLMSGSDDYLAIVLAKDIEDFERIHRTELSRLPRVARIQSSFAMRDIVNRTVPPVVFGKIGKTK
jgi:DNA-binding Lrp family transcriptional regulator